MSVIESVVFDPEPFAAPGRAALGLETIGVEIRDVDWGDSDMELFLIRQARGEIPADRHPPNQTITMKLIAEEGNPNELPLAEVLAKLQQKIGLLQEEGGFIARVMNAGGRFKQSVAYQIHKATLTGLDGWMMAHRQIAEAITLTMMRSPYCYGLKEQVVGALEGEGFHEIIQTINPVYGSAPGLLQVIVKSNDAFDWNGCRCSIESRDYSNTGTGQDNLVFEAENLHYEGNSSVVEHAGATSSLAVKNALGPNWTSILTSESHAGGLNFIHKGVRRIYMRVEDTSTNSEKTQFKLEYKKLGGIGWSNTPIKISKIVGEWAIIDLGECRLDLMPLGESFWQFRLLGRNEEGGTVYVDRFHIEPVEQHLVVATGHLGLGTPGVYEALDLFKQAAGNLNGKKEEISAREWETSESGAGDLKTTGTEVTRQINDLSEAKQRKAIVKGLTSKNAVVQIEFEHTALVGEIGSRVAHTVYVRGVPISVITEHQTMGYVSFITGPNGLHKIIPTLASDTPYLLTVEAIGGHLFIWVTTPTQEFGEPTATVIETEHAGAIGFADEAFVVVNPHIPVRRYRNFKVWAPESQSIVFGGKYLEFRTDGVFRQDAVNANAYAPVSPIGQLPYAPPSRLEGRPARVIVVPSSGNFDDIGDPGTHAFQLQIKYFPGYHFASESVLA